MSVESVATMMSADLEQMLLIASLHPSWVWSAVTARHVIVAANGAVLRAYWMPALLRMDELFAEQFVMALNSGKNVHCASSIKDQ